MSDDLDDYLQSLPDSIKDEIGHTIKAQAERLSEAQKRALQSLQQPPEETGQLEATCRAVPGENELEWIVQAGGEATTTDIRTGSGTDFDYGEAFEYGTKHQPARSFFWSTYRALRDDMQREINSSIEKALND